MSRERRVTLPRRLLAARARGSLRGDDFHETPRMAIKALLAVETFIGPIWEPACGLGAISTILEEHGHTVVSTDLVERGFGIGRVDFLLEQHGLAPNVITNPPYKLADEFARRACDLTTGKVALLNASCMAGRAEALPRLVQHISICPCLGVQPASADDASGRLRRPESSQHRRLRLVRFRSRPRRGTDYRVATLITARFLVDRKLPVKLLCVLGLNHQGERDAAGLTAHRLVKERGLTLLEVEAPAASHDDEGAAKLTRCPPEDWRQIATICSQIMQLLDRLERNLRVAAADVMNICLLCSAIMRREWLELRDGDR